MQQRPSNNHKAYCVQQEISLTKVRNDRRRYTKKYANLDCTWRIHALVLVDKNTWMIRRHIGKHNGVRTKANKVLV